MAPKHNNIDSRQAEESSPLLPKDGRAVSFHGNGRKYGTDIENNNGTASIEQEAAEGNSINDHVSLRKAGDRGAYSLEEAAKRVKLLFPVLVIGPFLTGIDYSYTMGSSSKIGSDLGGLSKSSWIATSYFLALAAVQPLYGKLSDIFGRKPCLLFAYLAFSLGCGLCGLSRTMNELIAARAVLGLGASGILGIFAIILTDTVPHKNRAAWQGVVMFVSAAGAALGAPLGGFMADTIGWRWSFLGQAPIALALFIVVAAALKLPPLEESSWKQKLKRIDFLGSFLFLVAVACLMFGLDRGGNVGWTSKWTYLPLCVCIPLFALLAGVEARFAVDPIVPARVILGPSNRAAYACNLFNYAALFGSLFFVPRYLQTVQRLSAAKSGAILLPAVFGNVSCALLSGFYIKKTGKYWLITVVAENISVLGVAFILLSLYVFANPATEMCIGLVIFGLCNGTTINTTLISLIANSKKSDQAVANAGYYVFRALGTIVGVSGASAVANQVLRTCLEGALGNGREADKIVRRVRDNLGYVDKLDPETRKVVIDCYDMSTRAAFIFLTGMAVFAAIASWFIIEKPLSDKLPAAEASTNEDESTL